MGIKYAKNNTRTVVSERYMLFTRDNVQQLCFRLQNEYEEIKTRSSLKEKGNYVRRTGCRVIEHSEHNALTSNGYTINNEFGTRRKPMSIFIFNNINIKLIRYNILQ